MVSLTAAGTLDALAEAVRASQSVVIEGLGSGRCFDCETRVPTLQVAYRGVISHDASDQVVSVRAGTPMAELQAELKSFCQCIPWGGLPWDLPGNLSGTVGGRLSQNLPHSLEGGCGNWRDWVLGLTIVRPDGTVAKAGSKAVKNVAGYDVQKLFVGARGTLGLVAEVILRTFPIKALPPPDVQTMRSDWPQCGLIQRTLRSNFASACAEAGSDLLATNSQTSTLYRSTPHPSQVSRFPDDWIIGWGFGAENLTFTDPLQSLMSRAKQIFDPAGKLNPGELNLGRKA